MKYGDCGSKARPTLAFTRCSWARDEWMALCTFSLAISDSEVNPARVVQLAVSKNGLISGTVYNGVSGNTTGTGKIRGMQPNPPVRVGTGVVSVFTWFWDRRIKLKIGDPAWQHLSSAANRLPRLL